MMTGDADPGEASGLESRTLNSGVWYFLRQIIVNIARLLSLAVLARVLAPDDFGIVALASVVLQFVVMVAEGGIRTYVIYYREADWRTQARSAFWLNVILTIGQLGLCAAAAPFVSSIFDEAELVQVFGALAGVFFVGQLSVVPDALVERELGHRDLAQRDIALAFVGSGAGIAMALTGLGVWSLIWPQLITQAIRFPLVLRLARWTPGWNLAISRWKGILRYTAHLMASNFAQLLFNDGDTLVVGKALGSTSLGYYSLAWNLSNLIGRNVSAVVSSVALPTLALVADSPERFKRAVIRMEHLLAMVSWPVLSIMFVLATPVVLTLYGNKWLTVVPLLQAFLVFTFFRSVTSNVGSVYNVLGRPDVGLKLTASLLPFYLGAILLTAPHGLLPVALAVAAVRVVGAIAGAYLMCRLSNLRVESLLRVLLPPLASALTAAAGVQGLVLTMTAVGLGVVARLAAGTAAGAILYVFLLARIDKVGYRELCSTLRVISPRAARIILQFAPAGARQALD